VLLAALAKQLPSSFSAQVGYDCQPSKNSTGSLEQTGQGSGWSLEGTKANSKSSDVLCSNAGESGENVAKSIQEEEIFSHSKVTSDVLLFCRANQKEPYVFLGR
jgi:hypothetical protein